MSNIEQTENRLRAASEAYYNGEPIMSDSDFDAMWKEHKRSREEDPSNPVWSDSILDRVGAKPAKGSGFSKVVHGIAMQSLDNLFVGENNSLDEFEAWLGKMLETVGDEILILEPKIDGLSVRATYVEGDLRHVVTRGDGNSGDDVTANILAANLLPVNLSGQTGMLAVNAEVFLSFSAFARLNERQKALGEELYSNPRNAAAGILRRHNPAEVADQGLGLIAHGIPLGAITVSYEAEVARLERYGIPFPAYRIMRTSGKKVGDGADKITYEDLLSIIKTTPYPTDGVVIKLNSLPSRLKLGSTSRAPRWAVALKFQQETAVTRLKAITVQVGRSGVLTPVAELEPVELDGSVVSRATLHNEDQVNRLGLAVGDEVEVRKAGAIIPEIIRSVTFDRMQGLEQDQREMFSLLGHIGGKCPSCGSTEVYRMTATEEKVEERKAYRCFNPSCPAQFSARIQHFCSRKCLDIVGVGAEAADAITARWEHYVSEKNSGPYDGSTVSSLLIEFLGADEAWLASLNWNTESGGRMSFGKSRAAKTKAAMAHAKKLPLHRWLFALGIPSIGENTSKEISRLFSSVEDLCILTCKPIDRSHSVADAILRIAEGASKDDSAINSMKISPHLGPVSCKALIDFCQSDEGNRCLSELLKWNPKSENYAPVPAIQDEGPLSGLTFVVTGTLTEPRDAVHEKIQKAGGKVAGSVTKATNFLVAGEKAGSKLAKAEKLGIQVLSEDALHKMIHY